MRNESRPVQGLIALVCLVFAAPSMGATYDPEYRPTRKYERYRPQTIEELRIWREEKALLRVNGLRAKPNDCQFSKMQPDMPYDRYNLQLTCDPLNIYSIE